MDKYFLRCFENAASYLPESLYAGASALTERDKISAEEFRIRLGRQFAATVSGKTKPIFIDGLPLIASKSDIERCMEIATKSSVHTYNHQIREGFISLSGGCRMGLCGTLIEENGAVRTMSGISSINIRIAKQFFGLSDAVYEQIEWEKLPSVLIISPPGAGKTTFLRDFILNISKSGIRVGLCDERNEVAACKDGDPTFDIGHNTDVISGGDKINSADILLRTMTPQYIAFDEITRERDSDFIARSAYAGASILATAHCSKVGELYSRNIYRNIVDLFDYIVEITQKKDGRSISLYKKGGQDDKAVWGDNDRGFVRIFGKLHI